MKDAKQKKRDADSATELSKSNYDKVNSDPNATDEDKKNAKDAYLADKSKSDTAADEEKEAIEADKNTEEDGKVLKGDDKEKAKKLQKEIENLEAKYESTKKAAATQYTNLTAKTNELASNKLLKAFVAKQRLEAKLAFDETTIAFLESPEQIEGYKARMDKNKQSASNIDKGLEDEQKKADKKNADDPEYQKAKKAETEEKQKKLKSQTTDTESRGKKDIDTSEITDRDERGADEYKLKTLKEKQKKISTAWQDVQDKAANEKDPKKKAKLETAAKKIESNMKAADTAIQDLSNKLSGGVGESNESLDIDFWTINALFSIIESQIEDFNNDIEILND